MKNIYINNLFCLGCPCLPIRLGGGYEYANQIDGNFSFALHYSFTVDKYPLGLFVVLEISHEKVTETLGILCLFDRVCSCSVCGVSAVPLPNPRMSVVRAWRYQYEGRCLQ